MTIESLISDELKGRGSYSRIYFCVHAFFVLRGSGGGEGRRKEKETQLDLDMIRALLHLGHWVSLLTYAFTREQYVTVALVLQNISPQCRCDHAGQPGCLCEERKDTAGGKRDNTNPRNFDIRHSPFPTRAVNVYVPSIPENLWSEGNS